MGHVRPVVVIIEDDAASAAALELTVIDWGGDVVTRDMLAGHRAARAIIADFDLGPGPDGVSVSRQLKQIAPDARVLVLSGVFNGKAASAAAGAGFDFMAKPASAAAIMAWLDNACAA
jgi:ActR/RegA family two-component response regulator